MQTGGNINSKHLGPSQACTHDTDHCKKLSAKCIISLKRGARCTQSMACRLSMTCTTPQHPALCSHSAQHQHTKPTLSAYISISNSQQMHTIATEHTPITPVVSAEQKHAHCQSWRHLLQTLSTPLKQQREAANCARTHTQRDALTQLTHLLAGACNQKLFQLLAANTEAPHANQWADIAQHSTSASLRIAASVHYRHDDAGVVISNKK